ncbi:MAG: hypothetical protein IJS90_10445 [Clostridia bacterium]|nr:hypothetical protein [Clostridia bacterium]
MKPNDIVDALNDVDPTLVGDSAPGAAKKKKKTGVIAARVAALAAALAVIIGVGAVAAKRAADKPTPSVPSHTGETNRNKNGAPEDGAQPTDVQPVQQDDEANALLKALTAFAAEYPSQPKYPENGDMSDEDEMDAWYEALRERREKCYGAGISLYPFFSRSLSAFLDGKAGENSVCSPLNIYFSLAMLAEISGGETRAQVLSLLGANDIETMRTQANKVFNANYRNDGSAFCILADSLWMNEDVDFKDDTLKTLAESYYASSFSGKPGTEEFDTAVREWINGQTGGLLKDYVSEIKSDPLTMISLYSTAYFGDKWQAEFSADSTEQGVFHSPSGDTDAEFMKETNLWGEYYWGESFGAVKKDLQQNETVWFILPDEGVSPEELLEDAETLDFLFTMNKEADWNNFKRLRVHLSVPKFDVSSKRSLKEGLEKLGVTDCFTEKADFTPLTDTKPVAVSDINHGARVIADEKGVTAAAYTEMMLAGAAMPPEEEMEFTLDRPFIFAVMSEDRMPLFVGIVNDP